MTTMPPRTILAWPQGLNEAEAARYCGLSVGTFRGEVDAGRAPKPVWITTGRKIWLRPRLDQWLDSLGGGDNDANGDPFLRRLDAKA